MSRPNPSTCPDCDHSIGRRAFLTSTAGAVAVGVTAGSLGAPAIAKEAKPRAAKELVQELLASLSSEQKQQVVLPWDNPLRQKVSANWHVTKANVGKFTAPQQELIHEVVRGITSEDGYGRFLQQMKEDSGGIERYSVAVFGDPAGDQFQFELTGRHLTMRADGDTVAGTAFGGPLVYGHSKKGNSDKNLFSYQTHRANEVFAALDADQQEKALLKSVQLSGAKLPADPKALPGISGRDLSDDQKELVMATLGDILAPYAKRDVDEALALVKAGGGVDALSMQFSQAGDLDDDKVWDNWRIAGPNLVCHFRGAPHVHAYIHIAKRDT